MSSRLVLFGIVQIIEPAAGALFSILRAHQALLCARVAFDDVARPRTDLQTEVIDDRPTHDADSAMQLRDLVTAAIGDYTAPDRTAAIPTVGRGRFAEHGRVRFEVPIHLFGDQHPTLAKTWRLEQAVSSLRCLQFRRQGLRCHSDCRRRSAARGNEEQGDDEPHPGTTKQRLGFIQVAARSPSIRPFAVGKPRPVARSPVLGPARTVYARTMDAARRDRLRARLLRGFVLATTLLGLVVIVLGAVPSVEVYHDANGCNFVALPIRLLATGPSSLECTASWVLVAMSPPVPNPIASAVVTAIAIAPGAIIWWKPKLPIALTWMVVGLVSRIATWWVTFDMSGLFARTVRTPLAWAYEIADVALAVVLIAGVPVFCAIVALVTPDAPEPDDERER